ncbi:MAG TPA: outer membrane protein assembly factor BamA [Rhabdochlamydiaceae bacterium]|nr:outer membrane protein assembly factor BamA [Rhabdochlamydiaceae bacterium]
MQNKLLISLSLIAFTGLSLPEANAGMVGAAISSAEVYEQQPIAKIDVIVENLPPGSTFDSKMVLSKLKSREGDPFSQVTFDSDLKTLAEEYDRIEPHIEVYNQQVYITLRIYLRPVIQNIHWHGNRYISTKNLQKELDIKPNAVFNRLAFNKAFNKLKEMYLKKGYFESQLSYDVVQDPKTQKVDIEIQIKEGRSGHVDDIVFKGFTADEESALLESIYTKKYYLLLSWLTGFGNYNEEAIEQDRLTIYNFLQDRGYADAKVDIRILESPTEGRIIVEIDAQRGQLYHFGNVTFDGNSLFTDKEIERVFQARPDEVYSPDKLRKTVEAIKDLYGRKGFIDTSVQYEVQLLEDRPLYNVRFQIDEGQEYKIGLIRVIGNVQTETRVILRESLLIPGETFDSIRLKVTQMRLQNMGYFKSVNVYAVRTQDDLSLGDNYRDVYIEVVETTTGNISLFMGFSSADNIFGGLDLTESNFNYKGITRVFRNGLGAVRGGGEYLHARASFGVKQRSYSVSWLTPYFLETLWRLGFEVNATHSQLQSQDYDIDTYGLSVYASYPLTPYWTFGTRYRIRNADISVDLPSEKEERQQDRGSGIISGLSASIGYDSTDSALKPHNGLRSILDAEIVGLGGHADFFRMGFINNWYTQLWRKGIMKYHFDVRFILPFGITSKPLEIPISERFFLGGVGSVRGYRDFDLGPHFSNRDPTGGISSSLISVEYLQEVFKFLDLFAFIDAGSVSLNRFDLGTYRMSYGFGARVDVMNKLPLILGLGFPVNPKNKHQVRKFFFSMGGQF